MEGAPKLIEQPSGPFAKRKWFNQLVVCMNALLQSNDKNGGRIVFGENGVIYDLATPPPNANDSIQIIINSNGTPVYADAVAEITGPV